MTKKIGVSLFLLAACKVAVPLAGVDDALTTAEDTPLMIATSTLLANDTGEKAAVVSAQPASSRGGKVEVQADGNLLYTPKLDDNGSDTFTYTVGDGKTTATATVTITVTPVNDAPVAGTDTKELVRMSLGASGTVSLAPLANDTDVDSTTLTIASIDTTGLHGSAVLNTDGTVTYTVSDCFTGLDSFKYTVSDGAGGMTVGTARVNAHITGTDTDADGFIDAEETAAGTDPNAAASAPRVMCGTLTYDRIPAVGAGSSALDYAHIVQKPIRNAVVQILDGSTDAVAGTGSSDDSGLYRIVWPATGPASIKVRTLSQMVYPPFKVTDNIDSTNTDPNDDFVYAMDSAVIDSGMKYVANLGAASGYGNDIACQTAGGCYTGTRTAAPFACLDTVYTAASKFAGLTNAPTFVPLNVHWSKDNVPSAPSGGCGKNQGCIGTSHYQQGHLYILGKEDLDTDEYDDHVMAHEWGHYFEDKIGRADSIGGSHGGGDILDPRVAFGEGWGNAFSAMALYPDAVYKDSAGVGQNTTSNYIDLENSGVGPSSQDPNPGWYSESSVQAILYDLFDPDAEPHDQIAYGLQPIYDVLVGAQKSTPALTTIFSFVAGIKATHASDTSAIDALVTHHTVDTDFGVDAVQDAFGGLESHGATVVDSTPVFADVTIAGAAVSRQVTGPNAGAPNTNKLRANRWYKFLGDGMDHTVTAHPSSAIDVDVFVYKNGVIVGSAAHVGTSDETTATFSTAPSGDVFVIGCQGFDTTDDSINTCDVTVN